MAGVSSSQVLKALVGLKAVGQSPLTLDHRSAMLKPRGLWSVGSQSEEVGQNSPLDH